MAADRLADPHDVMHPAAALPASMPQHCMTNRETNREIASSAASDRLSQAPAEACSPGTQLV